MSEGRWLARLRAHIPILVAMIIAALRTAEKLGMALEARALGLPGVQRTAFREIAFRPADYAYLVVVLALFSILIFVRFRFGFGAHPLYLF